MGIPSLLRSLKDIEQVKALDDMKNQRVGIDIYCWIHKGIFTCAQELANGQETDLHIQYVLRLINDLRKRDIIPIVIFDGKRLFCKQDTEKQRKENRILYKQRANDYLKKNDNQMAHRYFGLSVDVTFEMAKQFQDALENINVECIVAPYEADSQLAYLNQIGYIDFIITEDSDLLTFGAQKVIYKLDSNKRGILIDQKDLGKAEFLNLNKFNSKMFLFACVITGCDYSQQIPRVGIKTAFKIVEQKKEYQFIINELKNKYQISDQYEQCFIKAIMNFLFQIVYDPIQQKEIHNNYKEFNQILLLHKNKQKENLYINDILEENILKQIMSLDNFDFLGQINERKTKSIQNQFQQKQNLKFYFDITYTPDKQKMRYLSNDPIQQALNLKQLFNDYKQITPQKRLDEYTDQKKNQSETKIEKQLTFKFKSILEQKAFNQNEELILKKIKISSDQN